MDEDIRSHVAAAAILDGHPKRRSVLAPIACSEALMPALQLAQSSRIISRIAVVLGVLLAITILLMAFAPWQQTVTGSGYVVAYAPRERQQIVEAPTEGRIVRWNEDLVENTRVSEGDFIAEIRDLDDLFSDRLQGQLDNTDAILGFAVKVVAATENQLAAYRRVVAEIESAQNAYVLSSSQKVAAARQKLEIAEAAIPQLQPAVDRAKSLFAAGNISLEKLQELERKLLESQAKIREEMAYVSAAEAELLGKESERHAYIQKAAADVSYCEGLLDKARGEVSKAQKDKHEMESKVARQQTQTVNAPFDGFVVHISPNFGTGLVKKGDSLCTIVPDTQERAVQIWLDGNDAPLVKTPIPPKPGSHVRLQFEGWPAIQFAGWPSVAVGPFGGTVVSVDMIDNGKGQFRCQVRPDLTDTTNWPEGRFLRQGVRANGWVLLEQVPLWYEVWRKLNGFPPAVDVDSSPYVTIRDKTGGAASGDKPKAKIR